VIFDDRRALLYRPREQGAALVKHLLCLLAAALAMLATPALADPDSAQTVAVCGTPNNTPKVGNLYPLTMDTTGKLCAGGSGTVSPTGYSSTNGSSTITAGGVFQTLLAANSARKGCLIQNPTTATETLYVSVAVATGSATTAKSYSLAAGQAFSCSSGSIVVTDNIAIMATTTGHAFVETDQ
jgi:hypothetical protein